ncbi:MAG: hypothetical protein ACMXYC_03300, partial [Candidatus Woesearchaeota archaeon]
QKQIKSPMVFETQTVVLDISNTGEHLIEDVAVYDPLGVDAVVTRVSPGCIVQDDMIVWKGSLTSGQTRQCRYDVYYMLPQSMVLTTFLDDTQSLFSYNLTVKSPITVSYSGCSRLKCDLNISIAHHVDEPVEVDMFIEPSWQHSQAPPRGFKQTDKGFLFSERLTSSKKVLLPITIQSGMLHVGGTYTYKDKEFRLQDKYWLFEPPNTTKVQELVFNVTTHSTSVVQGQSFLFDVLIFNRFEEKTLQDVRLYLMHNKSILQSFHYPTILPQQGRRLVNITQSIYYPKDVEVVLYAQFSDGVDVYKNKTISILVDGVSKPEVKAIVPSKLFVGEQYPFLVRVKNTASFPLQYNITTQIPQGVTVIRGQYERTLYIPAQQEVDVYTFWFTADANVTFITNIIHSFANYSAIKEIEVQQKPSNLLVDISYPNNIRLGEIVPITVTMHNNASYALKDISIGVFNTSFGVSDLPQLSTLSGQSKVTRIFYVHHIENLAGSLLISYEDNLSLMQQGIPISTRKQNTTSSLLSASITTVHNEPKDRIEYIYVIVNNASQPFTFSVGDYVTDVAPEQQVTFTLDNKHPITYTYAQRAFVLPYTRDQQVIPLVVEHEDEQESDHAVVVDIEFEEESNWLVPLLIIVLIGLVVLGLVLRFVLRKKKLVIDETYLTEYDKQKMR